MTNPVNVHWFDSTMTGAPVLTGEAGTLLTVLDACLLSTGGFGSIALDSLVVSSSVATATLSTGHGFLNHTVVLIAGSTPSGLNGEKRITKTGVNTFTFDATGIEDQTASGTITAKMAPVGWTKLYSGTNKAVYARSSLTATAMVLRIDDSPAQYPTLIMYETMSDVDTGTGASTTRYFSKSSTANNTARPWRLFADDHAFYFFGNADTSTWPSIMMFGDVVSCRSGDAYHCYLLGHAAANNTSHLYFVDGTTTGAEFARYYAQTGSKVASGRYSHRTCQYLGVGSIVTPNYSDNAMHCWPVQVCESTNIVRGEMPGLFCPIHTALLTDGTILTQSSHQLLMQTTFSASYRAAMDITGPWR